MVGVPKLDRYFSDLKTKLNCWHKSTAGYKSDSLALVCEGRNQSHTLDSASKSAQDYTGDDLNVRAAGFNKRRPFQVRKRWLTAAFFPWHPVVSWRMTSTMGSWKRRLLLFGILKRVVAFVTFFQNELCPEKKQKKRMCSRCRSATRHTYPMASNSEVQEVQQK